MTTQTHTYTQTDITENRIIYRSKAGSGKLNTCLGCQSQTDQDGDRIASENACQKPAGNSRRLKKSWLLATVWC